ncbi:MAG: hypoxanthine phosphoribosyltransferase [Saprospiraceae bacterium]|nr:hypoxanthine phosphoribosyltransferase [Saprospiraceae bacterium]
MNGVVTVLDKQFELLIPKTLLEEKIKALADQLNRTYSGISTPILMIGILNGSFIFMADLIRQLNFACTVQFIRIESYAGLATTGVVKMESDVSLKWKDKHVIVIEDIVDTGHTLNRFIPVLNSYYPLSVRVCALLFKEEAVEVPVQLDHYCFAIGKKFVVGYGLDYDGYGRNLPEIYQLK